MNSTKDVILLILATILILPTTNAIICNPNLPSGCPSVVQISTTTFNNNTGSVNMSPYWGNYLWTDYNMPLIKLYGGVNYTTIAQTLFYPLSNPYNFLNSTTANNIYVPYEGAIANVNLGERNLNTTGKITANQTQVYFQLYVGNNSQIDNWFNPQVDTGRPMFAVSDTHWSSAKRDVPITLGITQDENDAGISNFWTIDFIDRSNDSFGGGDTTTNTGMLWTLTRDRNYMNHDQVQVGQDYSTGFSVSNGQSSNWAGKYISSTYSPVSFARSFSSTDAMGNFTLVDIFMNRPSLVRLDSGGFTGTNYLWAGVAEGNFGVEQNGTLYFGVDTSKVSTQKQIPYTNMSITAKNGNMTISSKNIILNGTLVANGSSLTSVCLSNGSGCLSSGASADLRWLNNSQGYNFLNKSYPQNILFNGTFNITGSVPICSGTHSPCVDYNFDEIGCQDAGCSFNFDTFDCEGTPTPCSSYSVLTCPTLAGCFVSATVGDLFILNRTGSIAMSKGIYTDGGIEVNAPRAGVPALKMTGSSINGDSANTGGYCFFLGYNAVGNRQQWLGDCDGIGNANYNFFRFWNLGNQQIISAVNGINTLNKPIAIGPFNPTYFGATNDDGTQATIQSTAVSGTYGLSVAGTSSMRDIYSKQTNNYNIGASGNLWRDGYFNYLYGVTTATFGATNTSSLRVFGFSQMNNTNITSNLNVGGNTTTNNLNATNNVGIGNNLYVFNNVHIDGNLSVRRPYWVSYDNSTQPFVSTSVSQIINISNNNDIDKYGINVINRQNLTFQQTGDYICTLSPEFFNTGSGALVTFWIQKNGVDVAWSNSRYSVPNNGYNAPSITYQFDITNPATDNVRFMWWSDSTNTILYSSGALTTPTRPSIPAVLLNCFKVSEITT